MIERACGYMQELLRIGNLAAHQLAMRVGTEAGAKRARPDTALADGSALRCSDGFGRL